MKAQIFNVEHGFINCERIGSKYYLRMPILTQTQLKVSLLGDPVIGGSLALGASINSQGSESKRLLIRQYNDRLYRS